jgi:hypothetical protein
VDAEAHELGRAAGIVHGPGEHDAGYAPQLRHRGSVEQPFVNRNPLDPSAGGLPEQCAQLPPRPDRVQAANREARKGLEQRPAAS